MLLINHSARFSRRGLSAILFVVISASITACNQPNNQTDVLPVDDTIVQAQLSNRAKGGNGKGNGPNTTQGRPDFAGPDPDKIPLHAKPPGLNSILAPEVGYTAFTSNLINDSDGILITDNNSAVVTVSSDGDSNLYRGIFISIPDNDTNTLGAKVIMTNATENLALPGSGTNQIILRGGFFNIYPEAEREENGGEVIMQLYLRQQTDNTSRIILCADVYDDNGVRSALHPALNDDGRDGCIGGELLNANLNFSIGQVHDLEMGVSNIDGTGATIFYRIDENSVELPIGPIYETNNPSVGVNVHTFGVGPDPEQLNSITVAEILEISTDNFVDRDLSELVGALN